RERDLEDPAQPSPALRLGVAKAVLHERLLDGQVEQQLHEGGRRDDRGEARVVARAQLAGRDHSREEPECGRDVDPEHRRRTSPEDSGAHRAPRYSQTPLPDGSLPSPAPTASRTLSAASLAWLAGWTLPATFVLLFVATEFQPHVTRGSASVRLVDLALLGAVLVAAADLRRDS